MSNEQELNRVLTLLADSLEEGKEFVLEQAPDVVQQLLLWKRVEYTACFVASLVVVAFAIWVWQRPFRKAIRGDVNDSCDQEMLVIVWGILGVILSLSGVIAVMLNLPAFLQVWLAPKVFLLEYLARLAS